MKRQIDHRVPRLAIAGPYRVEVPITRRVGVFGGTFDPPHVAHVVIAAAAIHQLGLDELVITVAGVPWQKVGTRTVSDASTRMEMAKRAFEPVEHATVSDIELRRSGNSYTIDTLESLSGPDVELFLLLGSDAAAGLDTWERHEDLANVATIAVFPRRGAEGSSPPAQFSWVDLPLPGLEVSSTDIRERRSNNEPITGLTPPLVEEMIQTENLYVDASAVNTMP